MAGSQYQRNSEASAYERIIGSDAINTTGDPLKLEKLRLWLEQHGLGRLDQAAQAATYAALANELLQSLREQGATQLHSPSKLARQFSRLAMVHCLFDKVSDPEALAHALDQIGQSLSARRRAGQAARHQGKNARATQLD